MASQHHYLISYDIMDPKRYRKIYAIIRGFGEPLQYSVFRCFLTEKKLEQLRYKLAEHLNEEDRLLIVQLCTHCVSKIVEEGPKRTFSEDPPSFRIL